MIRTHINRFIKRLQPPYDTYNRIEISRAALLHNINFFRRQTNKQIIPVVKGNAYGHGIEQVVAALKSERFPYIAVDGYFEAQKVRSLNSRRPILVMGMIKPGNFAKLRLRGLTFAVHDEATIHSLGRLKKSIKVHLDINTGMNRYGISPAELEAYLDLLESYPKLQLEGIMSHLADADNPDSSNMDEAVERFDAVVDAVLKRGFKPTFFHIGQSAGSLRVASRHANAVRLGIGLYGINPYPPDHPLYVKCQQLIPALSLSSTVSKVQSLKKGDKVSYNYTFTAPKDMHIGILPLGYHEGVNRALSNKGVVKIGRHFQPIVGRICMNHTMVSLEGINAQAGEEVVIYSNDVHDRNSIASIAKEHHLFTYSLLTSLSPDVRRYLAAK